MQRIIGKRPSVRRPIFRPTRFFATRSALILYLVFNVAGRSLSQTNDAGGNDAGADSASKSPPITIWRFDGGDATGKWTGNAKDDQLGPRPPHYPGFPATNRAAFFPGNGPWLVVQDAAKDSRLRMANGDSITLEAWMRVQSLGDGNYAYLVGKGRSRKAAWGDKLES